MSCSIPRLRGEQVRRCRPAGSPRSTSASGDGVEAAADHAVATPGEDQVGAGLQRALDLARCGLALGHLVPDRVVNALGIEGAAQLAEPAAERLAGVGDDGDLHDRCFARSRASAAAPARAAGEESSMIAPMPRRRAAGDVERVVHAAVHPRERDEVAIRIANVHASASARAVREAGGEQIDQAGVDGDRGRGVARRVARVGGQVLQARHVRPVAVDHQRGERGRSRTPRSGRTRRRPRSASAARSRSAMPISPTRIGSSGAPPTVEPTFETVFSVPSAVVGQRRDEAVVGAAEAEARRQHMR